MIIPNHFSLRPLLCTKLCETPLFPHSLGAWPDSVVCNDTPLLCHADTRLDCGVWCVVLWWTPDRDPAPSLRQTARLRATARFASVAEVVSLATI